MKKSILPVTRRVMPTVILNDYVKGISPMKGPITPISEFSIAKARTQTVDRLMAEGKTFEEAIAIIDS